MLFFLLAVIFTVLLYLIMRAYPRYQVDSFHAVVFNYYSCVLTGLVLTPDLRVFTEVQWASEGTMLTMALGAMFVTAFMLIGLTAQKVSVTATSLAGNMSLVIPVLFGLFVFRNNNKDFTALNYLGLVLALVALALGAIQHSSKASDTTNTSNAGQALWILPVLTFFATGTNNTLINFLSSKYYPAGQITVFMIIACFGAVLIGTSILIYRIIAHGHKLKLRSVLGGLLLGVPNFLSLYFLLLALAAFGNSAAYVFPIYNILTMLVSAIAAWLLYKERLNTLNKWGLVLAVLAIVLISYQELNL
ncbi:EamA-like transporter family protein [Dyadobacter sp. SG02]|uniref:EamA family transporter n=1 Tax=Dyadobacter sp. SG02 TaxID=1855291 RepID=UPI0008B8046A|nr:EamA family transporter [Dyadobacter sp. SG02]SEJ13325.1 EamA-like transporter family protein [Dyadobacter sp. SG02]